MNKDLTQASPELNYFIETNINPWVITDLAGNFYYINNAANALLNSNKQNNTLTSFWELFKNETIKKEVEQAIATGASFLDLTTELTDNEGRLAIYDWHFHYSKERLFAKGKKADEKSKQLFIYQYLIEFSPAAIALFDKNMRYLAVSKKWIEDYKLQSIDLINKSHYEIFPQINDYWKTVYTECLQGAVRNKREEEFIRRDGTKQWIRWDARPWYSSPQQIGGIVMHTEDVTESRATKEALLISEGKFRDSFENAPIGMAIVDIDGSWIDINESLCEMIGYSKEELLKLTFQDITHPDDLKNDLHYFKKLLAGTADDYKIEKRYFHKAGKTIWTLLAVSIVRNANREPLYFVSQIHDITEIKESAEKINSLLAVTNRQNARLKNFADIVSHNLRSHSGNINSLLDIIFIDHPQLKNDEMFEMLHSASENLKETIANLSEIASVHAMGELDMQPVLLRNTVNSTILQILALANASNVKIINDIERNCKVLALPAYLDSIILNFLTNGIKYASPLRDSFIKLSAVIAAKWVILQIEDNGLGIDLNAHGDKLFGLYKTFHKHQDSKGLGLFITRNQVEALGGKIEVESAVNTGTTFKIYLQNGNDIG